MTGLRRDCAGVTSTIERLIWIPAPGPVIPQIAIKAIRHIGNARTNGWKFPYSAAKLDSCCCFGCCPVGTTLAAGPEPIGAAVTCCCDCERVGAVVDACEGRLQTTNLVVDVSGASYQVLSMVISAIVSMPPKLSGWLGLQFE